jgi:hypothetical protein
MCVGIEDTRDLLADGKGSYSPALPHLRGRRKLIEENGGRGFLEETTTSGEMLWCYIYPIAIPNEEKNNPASRHAKNTGLL